MRIMSVQIENYKSFRSSPTISFEPGFNVIVGQNNVGKTALIEALSANIQPIGHRSAKNAPSPQSRVSDDSKVTIVYEMDAGDAERLLIDRNGIGAGGAVAIPLYQGLDAATHANNFLQVLRAPSLFQAIFSRNALLDAGLQGFSRSGVAQSNVATLAPNLNTHQLEFVPQAGSAESFATLLAGLLKQSVYTFKAERQNIGLCAFGTSAALAPNASNLPEVLNVLKSYPGKFKRFNAYVAEILPMVRWISVPPGPQGTSQLEIRVWSTDPDEDRLDLTVPLSQSGTGIGQVLAMLYVALETAEPRTIIIDEPQSYLHPGAVRKLIEILKQQQQHQIIVTTHSPEVIATANPRKLLRLLKEGAETVVDSLDIAKEQELRIVLADVGVRLADVFGFDAVLWVEGATEEACFPLIVERVLKRPLLGTKILGVLQTADFESKDATRVVRIYEKLSSGQGLVPPAIGFIFDREKKTEREVDELARRDKGRIHFLPRRMYENYLLNPEAIATILARDDENRAQGVTEQEVKDWLQAHQSAPKYYASTVTEDERESSHWVVGVHGANVLNDLFNALTECRVAYSKVAHGLALTEWLIEHSPNDLADVRDMLEMVS